MRNQTALGIQRGRRETRRETLAEVGAALAGFDHLHELGVQRRLALVVELGVVLDGVGNTAQQIGIAYGHPQRFRQLRDRQREGAGDMRQDLILKGQRAPTGIRLRRGL